MIPSLVEYYSKMVVAYESAKQNTTGSKVYKGI